MHVHQSCRPEREGYELPANLWTHRVELAVSKLEQLSPEVEPRVEEEIASHELEHQPPQRTGKESE